MAETPDGTEILLAMPLSQFDWNVIGAGLVTLTLNEDAPAAQRAEAARLTLVLVHALNEAFNQGLPTPEEHAAEPHPDPAKRPN